MNIRFGANYKLVSGSDYMMDSKAVAKVANSLIEGASVGCRGGRLNYQVVVLTSDKQSLVNAGVIDHYVVGDSGLKINTVTVLTREDAEAFNQDKEMFETAGQLSGYCKSFQDSPRAQNVPVS